jgi:hypothetical protein
VFTKKLRNAVNSLSARAHDFLPASLKFRSTSLAEGPRFAEKTNVLLSQSQ